MRSRRVVTFVLRNNAIILVSNISLQNPGHCGIIKLKLYYTWVLYPFLTSTLTIFDFTIKKNIWKNSHHENNFPICLVNLVFTGQAHIQLVLTCLLIHVGVETHHKTLHSCFLPSPTLWVLSSPTLSYTPRVTVHLTINTQADGVSLVDERKALVSYFISTYQFPYFM